MKNSSANKISLGDIVRIGGRKNPFVVVSSNTFNNISSILYVCPIVEDAVMGPLHVKILGNNGTAGIAICENVLPINPDNMTIKHEDHIPYAQVIEISDILQGIFEYD